MLAWLFTLLSVIIQLTRANEEWSKRKASWPQMQKNGFAEHINSIRWIISHIYYDDSDDDKDQDVGAK